MKYLSVLLPAFIFLAFTGIKNIEDNKDEMDKKNDTFKYSTEKFADLEILRYRIPGFDELSLKEKKLAYYLYEAALSGRDIYYDQNYKYNLEIKRTLEAVVQSYKGSRKGDDFGKFMVYTKRVWFSNGIHHHYSNKKFEPGFTKEYFAGLLKNSDESLLPMKKGEDLESFSDRISSLIFDPKIAPTKVNLDSKDDLVKTSGVNFYEGVSQKEVEDFYNAMHDSADTRQVWYGLNSKVVKAGDKIEERTWKVGGMYSPAIEKIVYWLEKAVTVAENPQQKETLEKLIKFYKTGDLKAWDEYNIAWVKDTQSRIDNVNGFIEVYDDPLGYKGYYEAIVSIKDLEASKRIHAVSSQAQWFEDHSPIADKFKKKNVVGISAKVITVVTEAGGASPSTPIGINLPNSNWIRKDYGSKSVNLGNIVHSYNEASSEEVMREFAWKDDEVEAEKKYGALTDDLHTDMHEVIGHASGQILPGVGTPKQTLKSFASTIEEARADLVALYYLPDQKLIDIGVIPAKDVYKVEYNKYIRNGLMLQLNRLQPGENLEESHMRNRQLIAKWVYENGVKDNVIEKKTRDGKTYLVINDYAKLRKLFGDLLAEIQRITSEGDYDSAKELVENYGVVVDQDLMKEVKSRYAKLNIAPYKGFINPVLVPVMKDGEIADIKVEYPDDFTQQMLYYAKNYSFLPNEN